jgi:hypothetical protein
MRHSYTSQAEALRDGLAQGHRLWYGILVPTSVDFPQSMHPAGYLMSSAEDMSRFMTAYFTGGRYGDVSVLIPAGAAVPPPLPAGYIFDGYWNPVPEAAGAGSLWSQSGGSVNYNSDLMLSQGQQLGVIVLLNSRPDTVVPAVTAYDIALGVTRIMQGMQPGPTSDRGFRQGWLLVDGILLLLISFALAQVLRLRGWAVAVRRAVGMGSSRLLRTGWPVLLDFMLAVLILFGVPALSAISWELAFEGMPDLAFALAGSAIVFVLVGLARTAIILLNQVGGKQLAQVAEPTRA